MYGDSSNKKAKKKNIPCRPGTIFEYFYRSSLFFRLVIFVIIFFPPSLSSFWSSFVVGFYLFFPSSVVMFLFVSPRAFKFYTISPFDRS